MPLDGTDMPYAAMILDRALAILGPNGEHWRQDYLYDGHGNHCILGAIQEVRREMKIMPRLDQTENLLAKKLRREHFGPKRWHDHKMLVLFNNASGRTFEEIRELMVWGREEALTRR